MEFTYETETAAAAYPVTLDEAKAQCGVDVGETDFDDFLNRLIKAATEAVEAVTDKAYINRTYKLYLSGFPSGSRNIELPRPPLSSVTSVKYQDSDDAEQTLASSKYMVQAFAEPAIIQLKSTESWPSVYDRNDAVVVEYVAGYGTASTDVPEMDRQAMLFIIGDCFLNREKTIDGIRAAANRVAELMLTGSRALVRWD